MGTRHDSGAETRWLSERELRAWKGFHRMNRAMSSYLSRRLAQDCGLSPADFQVLIAVSEAPAQELRAKDLGSELRWDRRRLSHQLARMESRGTVIRKQCPHDGRGMIVALTQAGRVSIELAAPINLVAVRRCFTDVLTLAQLDALAEISDALVANIEHDAATSTQNQCDAV